VTGLKIFWAQTVSESTGTNRTANMFTETSFHAESQNGRLTQYPIKLTSTIILSIQTMQQNKTVSKIFQHLFSHYSTNTGIFSIEDRIQKSADNGFSLKQKLPFPLDKSM
jgi:hypothetical protein